MMALIDSDISIDPSMKSPTSMASPSPATAAEQPCRRFSLAEIHLATEHFSESNVIGKGGFGKVYKGLIGDLSVPVPVAVKRLSSDGRQGEPQFVAEMETLTKVRHRNLVRLIGFCSERGEMILVYEYMVNGTLYDHLLKMSRNESSLSWSQRLEICIGAGRGIDYLHSGCSIIHRDVKPTNILLDKHCTAKVSDFGMAKLLRQDIVQSHASTMVMGTFGYIDPSYLTTGRVTRASDTYSFGVVLLEVLSGKPAIDQRLVREKIRNGKAKQVVHPRLKGEISPDCLKTFVEVAEKCAHLEPEKRMTMTRAVAQLELAKDQQHRRPPPRFQLFNAFLNKYIHCGSRRKEQGDVQKMGVEQQEEEEEAAAAGLLEKKLVPAFPLAEIIDITDNFSNKYLIAKGSGGGHVFHRVLKSGQDAAIKQLHTNLSDHEFITQVSIVSRLKHENVVQLVGYCLDGGVRVLLYEFAPRGSLHDILHGEAGEQAPAMSWAQRIKIAVEVAEGLLYIHDKDLIHRNISSSNVLLFYDEIAKITDLSVSIPCSCKALYPDEPYPFISYHSSSRDYHPPECKWRDQTKKGDVYSFGVLLLELLTGNRVVDRTRPPGQQQHILSWAEPHLDSDKVHNILDARLEAAYPLQAVIRMAAVAQLCLLERDDSRPNMTSVLKSLQIASQEISQQFNLKRNNSTSNVTSVLQSLQIASQSQETQQFNLERSYSVR